MGKKAKIFLVIVMVFVGIGIISAIDVDNKERQAEIDRIVAEPARIAVEKVATERLERYNTELERFAEEREEKLQKERIVAELELFGIEGEKRIAEANRITAEANRLTAEVEKIGVEAVRITVELDRLELNLERFEAGIEVDIDLEAEYERLLVEKDMLYAEAERYLEKSGRYWAEYERYLAEGERYLAEGERLLAEGDRLGLDVERFGVFVEDNKLLLEKGGVTLERAKAVLEKFAVSVESISNQERIDRDDQEMELLLEESKNQNKDVKYTTNNNQCDVYTEQLDKLPSSISTFTQMCESVPFGSNDDFLKFSSQMQQVESYLSTQGTTPKTVNDNIWELFNVIEDECDHDQRLQSVAELLKNDFAWMGLCFEDMYEEFGEYPGMEIGLSPDYFDYNPRR